MRVAMQRFGSQSRSTHPSEKALLSEFGGYYHKGYISSHERGITRTAVLIN